MFFSKVHLFNYYSLCLRGPRLSNFTNFICPPSPIVSKWRFLWNFVFCLPFFFRAHEYCLAIGEINIIQIIPIIVIFNLVLSRIAPMPSPRIHCSLPQQQPNHHHHHHLQSTPAPSTISIRINKNRFPSQVLKILSGISIISSQAPQLPLPPPPPPPNQSQPNPKNHSHLTLWPTNQKRLVQPPIHMNHFIPSNKHPVPQLILSIMDLIL